MRDKLLLNSSVWEDPMTEKTREVLQGLLARYEESLRNMEAYCASEGGKAEGPPPGLQHTRDYIAALREVLAEP